MSKESSRESLNAHLRARLDAQVTRFAREHGLTEQEVRRKVREFLAEDAPPDGAV